MAYVRTVLSRRRPAGSARSYCPRRFGMWARRLALSAADGGVGRENDEGVERDLFEISANESTIRLDKVLALRYPDQSRNYFIGLISAEFVLVNGQPVTKRASKLKAGTEVEVVFSSPADHSLILPSDVPLNIIYEDKHLLAINKEAGMVVHPAPGNWEGTVANALAHRYKQFFADTSSDNMRPGIVHRLDKGTSGVMVIGKSLLAQQRLQDQFRQRTVKKRYLAMSARNPFERGTVSQRVELAIGRHPTARTKMAPVTEERGGRAASTVLHLVGSDASNMTTLLQVVLETGRTHQIRVHLQALKAPILGDDLYGSEPFNSKYGRLVTRPMLHAHTLEIDHPVTKERLAFQASLPDDISALIAETMSQEIVEHLDGHLPMRTGCDERFIYEA